MKNLIAYATSHGCTEKCATKLQHHLNGDTNLVNLKKSIPLNLKDYEIIIIGGSIHAGQIQKKIKKFCEQNLDILKTKKLGLFICCMEEGETAQKEFNDAYPDELIDHASATGIFGGEFNLEKMNFLEKAIVKKVAKIDKNVSKINDEAIIQFSKQMKS